MPAHERAKRWQARDGRVLISLALNHLLTINPFRSNLDPVMPNLDVKPDPMMSNLSTLDREPITDPCFHAPVLPSFRQICYRRMSEPCLA